MLDSMLKLFLIVEILWTFSGDKCPIATLFTLFASAFSKIPKGLIWQLPSVVA